MTDKTKLHEALGNWIDSVAAEDDDDRGHMTDYINQKTPAVLENAGKIKFKGDDVMIGEKKIGVVRTDEESEEASIDFESADGKFSEKFNSVDDLYEFLSRNYNVSEDAVKLNETQILRISEGRVEDAVLKQPTQKSERAKRWAAVRNTKQPDGKAGDYESGDTSEYNDPIKGKSDDAAFDGHGKDSRHLKGYYDAHDPRKTHKDPVRGGSEPAHGGAASDLETDGGYDSHDVRSEHNK